MSIDPQDTFVDIPEDYCISSVSQTVYKLNNFNNINHNNVVNSFFELNNTGKFTVKPVVS